MWLSITDYIIISPLLSDLKKELMKEYYIMLIFLLLFNSRLSDKAFFFYLTSSLLRLSLALRCKLLRSRYINTYICKVVWQKNRIQWGNHPGRKTGTRKRKTTSQEHTRKKTTEINRRSHQMKIQSMPCQRSWYDYASILRGIHVNWSVNNPSLSEPEPEPRTQHAQEQNREEEHAQSRFNDPHPWARHPPLTQKDCTQRTQGHQIAIRNLLTGPDTTG